MAIEIEWQLMPPGRSEEGTDVRMFPRIVNSSVVDEMKLAKIMSEGDAYTRGQIKGVLTVLGDTIAKLLAEGKTVELPGLGTFKLSVGANGKVTLPNISASNVEVRGINFQPADDLMERISKPDFRVVARGAAPVVPLVADMVLPLSEYLDAHGSITRTEFAGLFKLTRATACRRLRELQEMGVIKSEGYNKDTRYVKQG